MMLRKFSVENYKNFREKVTLDLTRKRDYTFNKDCVNGALISKVVLMGRNASGKTNFAYALFDIVYTLTDNLCHPLQKDVGSFLNGDNARPFATFIYEFQNGTDEIVYEYSKVEPERIVYESLKVNGEPAFVFDYIEEDTDVSGLASVNAGNLSLEGLDGSISALRYIMNNTVQSKGSTIAFLKDFVSRMLYFRYVNGGPNFIGFHKVSTALEPFITRNGLLGDFQKFLKECGVDVELETAKGPMEGRIVQKFGRKKLLFEPLMSSGTSVLELFYFWSRSFDEISFLYIDEFDAFFHFKLARKIIQNTISRMKSQAVFTTLNTGLVDTGIMRPDCYMQINHGAISSFADSTQKELREAHNLEKMLRKGEFD